MSQSQGKKLYLQYQIKSGLLEFKLGHKRENYIGFLQNEFEALGEAKCVKQQWEKL